MASQSSPSAFRKYLANPMYWRLAVKKPRTALRTAVAIAQYPRLYRVSQAVEGLITGYLGTVLYRAVLDAKDRPGPVVEAGAFKGLSTCFLSLAAAQVGKRVKSFELFTGLPMVDATLDSHWKPGDYSSDTAEYDRNVRQHGRRDVVDLHIGDARENLLPVLGTGGFSVAFVDVDVYEVMTDLLRQLWSVARGGEVVFVHDTWSPGVRRAIDELKLASGNRVDESEAEPGCARLVFHPAR
jgi:hypothetical protein